MSVAPSRLPGPGRPAAASRDEVLRLASRRYLRGARIDVQAIALELGLGRTTIYRWFGSREDLIGEVAARAAEPLLARARREAAGSGADALLETFDRFNRDLASSPALRRYIEQEREAAMRVLTSTTGRVHPRIVELIAELIEREQQAGAYDPPVDAATLAYATVRLAEAFLFSDAVAGMRSDVDRLIEVERVLLGSVPRP